MDVVFGPRHGGSSMYAVIVCNGDWTLTNLWSILAKLVLLHFFLVARLTIRLKIFTSSRFADCKKEVEKYIETLEDSINIRTHISLGSFSSGSHWVCRSRDQRRGSVTTACRPIAMATASVVTSIKNLAIPDRKSNRLLGRWPIGGDCLVTGALHQFTRSYDWSRNACCHPQLPSFFFVVRESRWGTARW